eukprot:2363600-Rhodomonas_salina.6
MIRPLGSAAQAVLQIPVLGAARIGSPPAVGNERVRSVSWQRSRWDVVSFKVGKPQPFTRPVYPPIHAHGLHPWLLPLALSHLSPRGNTLLSRSAPPPQLHLPHVTRDHASRDRDHAAGRWLDLAGLGCAVPCRNHAAQPARRQQQVLELEAQPRAPPRHHLLRLRLRLRAVLADPGVVERLLGGDAAQRVHLEQAADEVTCLGRDQRVLGVLVVACLDRAPDVVRRRAHEGRLAAQQDERHHAHRPHVALAPVPDAPLLGRQHLGRNVERRPARCEHVSPALVVAAEPEVDQLHARLSGNTHNTQVSMRAWDAVCT